MTGERSQERRWPWGRWWDRPAPVAVVFVSVSVVCAGCGTSGVHGSSTRPSQRQPDAKASAADAGSSERPGAGAVRGFTAPALHGAAARFPADGDDDGPSSRREGGGGGFFDRDDSMVIPAGRAASAADARAVGALVKRYYALGAAEDGRAACGLLLPSLRRTALTLYGRFGPSYLHGSSSCPVLLTRIFRHHRRELEVPPTILGVRLVGSTAFVLLGSPRMPASYTTPVRHGRRWLLDEVFSAPLA